MDDTQWNTLDPAQRRRRTLDALKQLLLREAREQALLLIFEDLHWIDGLPSGRCGACNSLSRAWC